MGVSEYTVDFSHKEKGEKLTLSIFENSIKEKKVLN